MQTRPSLIFVSLGHFFLLSLTLTRLKITVAPHPLLLLCCGHFAISSAKLNLFAAFRVFLRPSLVAAEPPCSARLKTILPSTSTLSPQLLTFFLFWRCKHTTTRRNGSPPPLPAGAIGPHATGVVFSRQT